MGEVYEAEDTKLGKRVAIKLRTRDDDRDAQARFEREARTACLVVHEHVVQILDSGRDGDRDYLIMEYVEGRDLRAELAADGPMAPPRASAIARQLLSGLDAIHAAGLVHRDIKPANVMLGDDDFVKVMDFGVSKTVRAGDDTLTDAGKAVGTPQFMAPEQLIGDEVDQRADLYATGLTLFAMLAGKVPFDATAFSMIAAGKLAQPAPSLDDVRPGLPRPLVAAVSRALEKHPRARFATAREMAAALAREPTPAEPTAATRAARPSAQRAATPEPVPRRPWPLLVVAVALAAAAVAAAVWIGSRRHDEPRAAPAPQDAPDHAARAAEAERAGKLELAIAEYHEVLAAKPGPDPLYHLGELSERLGRSDEAATYFERYLAAAPEANDRAAVAERIARLRKPVAAPPDAAVATARPTAPPQQCLCHPRDEERYGTSSICRVRHAPRCRCMAEDGSSVCPRFDSCTEYGSGCADWGHGNMFRCSDAEYGDYHLPGKPGDACAGYNSPDSPVRGHLECLFCMGEDDFPYRGHEGDPCVGYTNDTGERIDGTMYLCRSK